MKKKYLLQLGTLLVLGFGAFFSLLLFDRPELHPNLQLLEISVIVRDTDSSCWSTARQGMDQAAVDLGVELRFITLGQANSAAEQRQLIQREISGGADALILVPADSEALGDTIREASEQVPVVTIESDMSEWGAAACISVDNTALGGALGKSILNGVPSGGTVLFLDTAPGSGGLAGRIAEAERILREAGREVLICSVQDTQALQEALPSYLTPSPQAVAAFEPAALEQAILFFRERENAPLIYGVGSTGSIASALEQGRISAIAAQNEFALGNLAVDAAVDAVQNRTLPQLEPMTFSIVRQENMYNPENQKLIFPVTK